MFSGAKKSATGTVLAIKPKKRFVSSWFSRRAPKSACISGAGGASDASWYVKS
jgi:hypothetical protein